jgi:hypothetical protein
MTHAPYQNAPFLALQGTDIGPVGASALMKLISDQNNLDMGLELFYKMTSMRTTFNR